jgi:sodium/hydrogen antiporter
LELDSAFGLIAGVLVVSALSAGLVERAPVSFPMLFLGFGFLIGDRGLGFISIGLDNSVLEVVAVVALALVLFLDAVNLELTELRRDWLVPSWSSARPRCWSSGCWPGSGCCCSTCR